MSRGQRLALLGVAAAIAVVAVIVLLPRSGQDGSDPPRPTSTAPAPGDGAQPSGGASSTPRAEPRPQDTPIEIRDGRPVGGVKDITVRSGDVVRLAFRSDKDDEVHIHGYDRYVPLRRGRTARANFRASIEGAFEIESHTTGMELASLEVRP